MSILENILTYFPNDRDVLFRTAVISQKIGKIDSAEIMLKKILKQNEGDFDAEFELARVNLEKENYRECIEILNGLIESNSDRVREEKIREVLAEVFIRIENYEYAERELKRLIEFSPDSLEHLISLAKVCESSGKNDEALRIYQEIVAKDSTKWEVYVCIGDIYFKKGYLDKSLIYYRQALKIENRDSTVYYRIGQVYEDKQIVDKALSYYKECIRITPDYSKAYFAMADLFRKQGLVKDSIELYERLLKYSPDNKEALYRLSRIYVSKKDHDRARETLEKLTEKYKDDPRYHLELAKVYRTLGKTDESISEAIQVVNIAPIDSKEAREAQDMLRPDAAGQSGM